MAVTIEQIANLAGVSRGTVDRALNNRGRVNPEVAANIRRIADELGYIPGRRKNIPKGAVKKIGIITQLSKSSFMIQLRKGIYDAEKLLSYRGIELIVKECSGVDEQEQLKAIRELADENISGLALMPVDSPLIRQALNAFIEEKKIPVITFNSDIIATKRCCFVGLDNKRSGKTAAGLIAMLTGGTGKVLVLTGFFSNTVSSFRVDGFIEELKLSSPDIELIGVQCSFDDAAEVKRLIISTLDTHPDLAAIFVASGGQAGISQAFTSKALTRRPHVIIYDLTPKNQKLLHEGNVDFLIDQEVYIQGYQPPLLLADILLRGIYPEKEYYYTNIRIMTKYNLPD